MSEESAENKPKAESVGQIIVKAREARGMDREDLARAVHLGVGFLAAIEEGRWQDLPGDTYARSYIISLCSELGLQKREMLEKYASDAHRDTIDDLSGAEPFRTHEDELNDKPRAVPVPALVLLACAALAVVGYFGSQDGEGSSAPAAAPAESEAVESETEATDDSLINASLGISDSAAKDTGAAQAEAEPADTAHPPSLAAPSSASGRASAQVSLAAQPLPVAKSRASSRLDISCDKDSAWIEIRSPGAETWASWIRQDGVRYSQTRGDTMYVRTGGLANLSLKLNHLKIEPKRAEFVIYGGQLVR